MALPNRCFPAAAFALLALLCAVAASAQPLRIGGTGGATEPMRMIGGRFSETTGIEVEVIHGLGSSGGVAAAGDSILDLTITSRPPTPRAADTLNVVFTACTPYGLATSHPEPGSIDSTAVAAKYAMIAPAWPDGTPMKIILRPRIESDIAILAGMFPGLPEAIAQARQQTSIPIGATAQDNADLAERIRGSLTGISYSQVVMEHRALKFVAIDGVQPSIETMESGRYPYAKKLYFMALKSPRPELTRFLGFMRSEDGIRLLRDTGMGACRPA